MVMIKPCIKCGAENRNKRGKCEPCTKIATAKYRVANREKARVVASEWAKNNPEKARIKNAKYKKANREKLKQANAKWWKDNPELRRVYRQTRRSRKLNNGKLSTNLTETLYKKQKGKCVCCKKPLGKDYHLDHIMPLALGGKNEDWNIQLLKASCNFRKSKKHPIDYMQSKGFLL